MKTVNVRFNEVYTRSYHDSATIADVVGDQELKVVAGWGDNVRALVGGVEQPMTALAPDGGTVVIETRANTKAV